MYHIGTMINTFYSLCYLLRIIILQTEYNYSHGIYEKIKAQRGYVFFPSSHSNQMAKGCLISQKHWATQLESLDTTMH